ncbi:unnamed protein product [Paramecium sonneborni]|uniref:Casein kinase I n=1 Tax=Paramecium sonneborni TaxID=65129 RepID=A0A8S1RNJ6_9CILI|nr:unnamed protein product [Paramecium sonneborni]
MLKNYRFKKYLQSPSFQVLIRILFLYIQQQKIVRRMYLQTSSYQILCMIGQGSSHQVFKVKHNITQKEFALKIEKCPKQGQIESEIKILKELNKIEGISQLIDYGTTDDNKGFLIMPLLNCSLRDLVKCQKLSLSCILAIGLSIIKTLEQIHRKKILHLDIKPDNIMIQETIVKNSQQELLSPGFIKLIDFGLSQFIGNSKCLSNVFFGSLNFASRASHRGEQLSYKDDLESLFYVLIYLRNGKLPWSQRTSMKSQDFDIQQIGEIKTSLFNTMTLSKKFPLEFLKFMSYIDQLKYDEIPKYSEIKDLFIKMLQTTSLSTRMDQFLIYSTQISCNQLGNQQKIQIQAEKQHFNNNSIDTQIQEDVIDVEAQVQHLYDFIGKYITIQIKSITDIRY